MKCNAQDCKGDYAKNEMAICPNCLSHVCPLCTRDYVCPVCGACDVGLFSTGDMSMDGPPIVIDEDTLCDECGEKFIEEDSVIVCVECDVVIHQHCITKDVCPKCHLTMDIRTVKFEED